MAFFYGISWRFLGYLWDIDTTWWLRMVRNWWFSLTMSGFSRLNWQKLIQEDMTVIGRGGSTSRQGVFMFQDRIWYVETWVNDGKCQHRIYIYIIIYISSGFINQLASATQIWHLFDETAYVRVYSSSMTLPTVLDGLGWNLIDKAERLQMAISLLTLWYCISPMFPSFKSYGTNFKL